MATKRDIAKDEEILTEARARFKRCAEWEADARTRHEADVKFCEGDSDNGFQWDQQDRTKRSGESRPSLTINKTRQHCLQIVNDARQHKAAINVRPVGDGATYEAAKIFEGVVRHIEYISNASEAYESASWQQVVGGWGYWRVLTDFMDDKSFDQEIYIRRVPDPLSVYLDPDIQQFDGSDAGFGFVFRDVLREDFEAEYPAEEGEAGANTTLGDEMVRPIEGWDDTTHVRTAEYYRKSQKKDELLYLADGTITLKSEMDPDLYKAMPEEAVVRRRHTTRPEIEWFKIVGRKIVDRKIWPGSYIPLVRVIGEETVIDGQLDRKGHTRALKDPQRMYNFWSSSATEHVALQSKSPYIAPAASIEGHEMLWANANRENRAVLTFNHKDDEGKDLPAPARQAPPVMSTAYMQGMHTAQQELMMASGQYQAQMGENENAKSGVAIQQRQRQGDNATYHYIDHLAQAIRFTGRILLDLIPKIYDTPRVIKIMAENGDQTEVHIDPNAPEPHQMMIPGPTGQMVPVPPEKAKQAQSDPDIASEVKTIFNPNVGKYFVQADVGPAFGTKRQEQFNALSQMMERNSDLVKIAGDLLFAAADFPMADELQERFKRAIPANILGTGPPPEVAQMKEQYEQQVKMLQNSVAQMHQQLTEKDAKLQGRADEADIRTYDAETRRLAAVGSIDPEALKVVVRQMVSEMVGMPVVPLMAAHAHAEQQYMPAPPEAALAAPEQPVAAE
jgi:hypothetical protein